MSENASNSQADFMATYLETFVDEQHGMDVLNPATPRHVVMLVYPGMFALDMIGPMAVLQGMPNTTIHQLWKSAEPVKAGPLTIVPTGSLADCPETIDILLLPGGGTGTLNMMRDAAIVDFVRTAAARATYITSVCTGSLILAAAGLLDGRRATSHWATLDVLPRFGATPMQQRYVEDGHIITAAGVSAGIDFALALTAKIAGERFAKALQLEIEYDPAPPFASGSPDSADAKTVEAMRRLYAPFVDGMKQVSGA